MAADSNTETATGPSESEAASGVQKGSEFANPAGAKDDAIWAKHFGKDGKDPTSSRSSSKSGSDGKPAADKSKTSESGRTSSGKSTEPSDKSKERERSSSSKEEGKSKSSPTKQSESESSDSTEATGRKTADKDGKDKETPADPEAPLKKARDLYKEAKGTEDRRKARSLYKRAMVEAFGEIPPEFDDKRYAAVRTERAAADAKLKEQAQKNEARIQEAADKLKAPIYVLRQLEGAKLADRISVPLVERAIHVMKALRSLEDGDFTQLAEVVSRAAGVDHDEAMKRFVKGVKVTPEGRAARTAAAEAQQRAAAAEQRIQQLEARLQERESQQTEAQKRAAREQQVTEHRERYLDEIRAELDDHPALQLPRGAERIMAYQIRHADKSTRSARYSHQQVADRIVAGEKRRLQEARHLLDEGEAPPSRERSGGNGGPRSVSRTETVDAGVRSRDPMARFDEIFEKHRVAGGRR